MQYLFSSPDSTTNSKRSACLPLGRPNVRRHRHNLQTTVILAESHLPVARLPSRQWPRGTGWVAAQLLSLSQTSTQRLARLLVLRQLVLTALRDSGTGMRLPAGNCHAQWLPPNAVYRSAHGKSPPSHNKALTAFVTAAPPKCVCARANKCRSSSAETSSGRSSAPPLAVHRSRTPPLSASSALSKSSASPAADASPAVLPSSAAADGSPLLLSHLPHTSYRRPAASAAASPGDRPIRRLTE